MRTCPWVALAALLAAAGASLALSLTGCALRRLYPVPPGAFGGGTRNTPSRNMASMIPLTPAQAAACRRAGALEMRARAARARGDWAGAAAAYRAETRVAHVPAWTWTGLGLMLDHLGRTRDAYIAYRRGAGTPVGSSLQGDPEAAARLGLLCADRGLHADACECYYAARREGNYENARFLPYTLSAPTTSRAQVRSLLEIALGLALDGGGWRSGPAAWAAFRAAARLTPGDPRPWYFLADGLRRAGRFPEAEAAFRAASRRDTGGALRAPVARGLAQTRRGARAS